MTSPVETVAGGEMVRVAAERMRATSVGALPVVDGGRLVGIVTDRDITVRSTAAGCDPCMTTVRTVMTPQIITCQEDDEVTDVARLMVRAAVRRLPVLDAQGEILGMVSVDDLATVAPDEGAADLVARPRPPH